MLPIHCTVSANATSSNSLPSQRHTQFVEQRRLRRNPPACAIRLADVQILGRDAQVDTGMLGNAPATSAVPA